MCFLIVNENLELMDMARIDAAQAILENAHFEVMELLSEVPEMKARVHNMLTTTINGLKNATRSMGHILPDAGAGEPLTHFMGKPLGNTEPKRPISDKEPAMDDVKFLKEKAKDLYNALETLTNPQILESEGHITIRAMAKVAGMSSVTNEDPETVDSKFIDQIREAKVKKVEKQKAIDLTKMKA